MTLHVLYNDGHLEADAETGGQRQSDKGEGLKEREGLSNKPFPHFFLMEKTSSCVSNFPHGHQRKLSGFTADYKLNGVEPGAVYALQGGPAAVRGQGAAPSPGLAAGYLLHFTR